MRDLCTHATLENVRGIWQAKIDEASLAKKLRSSPGLTHMDLDETGFGVRRELLNGAAAILRALPSRWLGPVGLRITHPSSTTRATPLFLSTP